MIFDLQRRPKLFLGQFTGHQHVKKLGIRPHRLGQLRNLARALREWVVGKKCVNFVGLGGGHKVTSAHDNTGIHQGRTGLADHGFQLFQIVLKILPRHVGTNFLGTAHRAHELCTKGRKAE